MNLNGRFLAHILFLCLAFFYSLIPKEYLPLLPCELCAGGTAYCDNLINMWDLSYLLASVFDFR